MRPEIITLITIGTIAYIIAAVFLSGVIERFVDDTPVPGYLLALVALSNCVAFVLLIVATYAVDRQTHTGPVVGPMILLTIVTGVAIASLARTVDLPEDYSDHIASVGALWWPLTLVIMAV